ncbi:MAG: hypothetical protein ABIT09_12720 [Croceibacterium sp.]
MRYFPAAVALSLLAGVTASVGYGAPEQPDPAALALEKTGEQLLAAGKMADAIGTFEAALAVDPGYTRVYLHLAEAARNEGLQGKAIHYYRLALAREPNNLAAISGEGQAMVEKGAVEKARRNLAQLRSICGTGCAEAKDLAVALERGPRAAVLTAEAVTPSPVVTKN